MKRCLIKQYLTSLAILFLIAASAPAQWYQQYQDLAAIEARLDAFVTEHPDLASSFAIGTSHEGRSIRGIRIAGTNATRETRPAVLLNGTQHAREWISPMTNIYAADQLLSQYGTDSEITRLLDQVEFYVIPVVNPDGYEYSWTSNRNWRKNRRVNRDGTYGVDLNRNWDYGWGFDSGSSSDTDSDTYRGTTPFSEPETIALRDFYYEHQNLVGNIDFHSYSQLILTPFGYTEGVEPADAPLMNGLAEQMSDSMRRAHGEYYDPVPASDLYLASGISIDWTYGDQNVYSYTIELRPRTFFPGFELPEEEIVPTVQEAFAAVLDLGEFTADLAQGDFNIDGNFDCEDLDALSAAVLFGTEKYEFDVDGDGLITASDTAAWLAQAGARNLASGEGYLPGDANLDGNVDVSDFNTWNANRYTSSASWCSGDFSSDGLIDVSDFNIWNEHKFQGNGELVPEPVGSSWWLLAIGLLIPHRGRRENSGPGFSLFDVAGQNGETRNAVQESPLST